MTVTTFYCVEMVRLATGLLWVGAVVMTMVVGQGAQKTLPLCARRKDVPEERIFVAVLTAKMLAVQECAKHRPYCI